MRRRRLAGYTLVEVMMAILVVGILAALAIPAMNPGLHDQLQAGAGTVAGDLAYARSLAVANNSSYRLTFDIRNNLYYLEHTGANAALNVLPSSAFYTSGDAATRRTTRLGDLPPGGSVRLAAVGSNGSSPAPRTAVEFGPLGQTLQAEETVIWLSAGAGTAQRFVWVCVNPVTGLATIEAFGATGPPAAIAGNE